MIDEVVFHDYEILSERLRLRSWRSSDADDFARMNADDMVMADLGGALSREASDQKLERFQRSFDLDRITRWVVTDPAGRFVGYCGIVAQPEDHWLGAHHEIGWRLTQDAWGHGYATEAAAVALSDAFGRIGCDLVLAYTAPDNVRSRRVMAKLGLERRPSLDFTQHYDGFGPWSGLVWAATPDSADSENGHTNRGWT